jgi:hypothetical protein
MMLDEIKEDQSDLFKIRVKEDAANIISLLLETCLITLVFKVSTPESERFAPFLCLSSISPTLLHFLLSMVSIFAERSLTGWKSRVSSKRDSNHMSVSFMLSVRLFPPLLYQQFWLLLSVFFSSQKILFCRSVQGKSAILRQMSPNLLIDGPSLSLDSLFFLSDPCLLCFDLPFPVDEAEIVETTGPFLEELLILRPDSTVSSASFFSSITNRSVQFFTAPSFTAFFSKI